MKHNRITRQISKGKKQGYYKIKARQLKLKAIIDTIMLDL